MSSGIPMQIESIKNPKKVSMGPRASGVITEDGNLYTFGNGNWGILGHGNEKNVSFKAPKLVEKFVNKNIRVKDTAFGRYHAAAITEDGDLYTWGYGGKAGYFNYFNQEIGALGHGKIDPFFTPEKVQFFEEHNLKVEQVACGINHTVALCDNGSLYTWGQGLYGVLGNGNNQGSLLPQQIEEFQIMQSEAKEEGLDFKIKKISGADEFTGVLSEDGQLYVWGKNDKGQLGVGSGIGIDMIESENLPKFVEYDGAYKDKPEDKGEGPIMIKDFTTGTNTMLSIDSDDRIYKTGHKIDYTPTLITFDGEMLEKDVQKKLKCGERHYVVIDKTHNRIHCTSGVFRKKSQDQHEGFRVYDADEFFDKGKVLDISMKYDTFGAIVQH